jgi:hypothetical protein
VWRHILETKYRALQAQAVDEGEMQEYLATPQDYRDPIFFGASADLPTIKPLTSA